VIEHELARGLSRDLLAKILRDKRQRQIDARRDARRTPDIAIADEDPVGLQFHLRIGAEKMPGAPPMRGGAAAIEQTGFGEDVGAGADAGDADTALGHGPHEGQRLPGCRGGLDALAARHDQRGDRAGSPEIAREHLDAGGAAHRACCRRQYLDRRRHAGKARGDFEHRNRAGGVQQLEIGKYQNTDHDSGHV